MSSKKTWRVYLSGEIHSDWRKAIIDGAKLADLPIEFSSPVTDHAASDNCGVKIFGKQENSYWNDHMGAQLNTIRNRTLIGQADIVIVRFGEQYRQWNAAFDAGYASALGKPLITLHPAEFVHALKEVDAAALAVAETVEETLKALVYIVSGKL